MANDDLEELGKVGKDVLGASGRARLQDCGRFHRDDGFAVGCKHDPLVVARDRNSPITVGMLKRMLDEVHDSTPVWVAQDNLLVSSSGRAEGHSGRVWCSSQKQECG